MALRALPRVVLIGSAALLLLASCSTSSEDSPPSAFAGPVGVGEGAVNVLSWPGYVAQGDADDGLPNWAGHFESETGCAVNLREFGTSDEAVGLMEAGAWDVVSASGDAAQRLVDAQVVQPVNTSLIAGFDDIGSDLTSALGFTVDGTVYGVPMARSANLLLYNTKKVDPAPTSWAGTFDPASEQAGKVSLYDSPMSIADAAVNLMETRPDLAITSPYALDQAQFDAVKELLSQQWPVVSQRWSDYLTQAASFTLGDSTLGMGWRLTADVAAADDAPVKATKPKVGTTGRSDAWMISATSHNRNCAYLWVDWMLSPQVNAAAAENIGAVPANASACKETDEDDYCEKAHADDADYWRDVHFWLTPTAQCQDGRTDVECVPYSRWVETWNSMRPPE